MPRCLARLVMLGALGAFTLAVAVRPSIAGQESGVTPAKTATGPPRTQRPTGWVFEIHLGSMPDRVPSKVRMQQLPAAGPGFTTIIGDPTRRVPSWYFGDGAAMANAVASFTGDTGRIVPLDPVLTAPSVSRQSGANFGVRIGHTITGRVLVGFSFDQVSGRVALTGPASSAFAAATASFKPYWDSVLTRPQTTNVSTTSTMTTADSAGSEKILSVDAQIRVITLHGWTPYVTVGAGFALPLPAIETRVTLVGNYRFNLVNPGRANDKAAFNESDQVQVRYEVLPAVVGILGVGVERHLSGHFGVRADLRSFLGANVIRTRIDTQPASVPYAPTAAIRRGFDPSLQVSTDPQLSSLSLHGVDHFDSLEAVGVLPSFSAGFFVRF